MPFYLLTAFGKDRPGMVSQVTKLVYQAGGNIEDASMTRLGGEFTMMLIVKLPKVPTALRVAGLNLNFKPVDSKQALAKKPTHATHLISVYGIDHPGIVYKVTHALAGQRINITDLNTKTIQRAMPTGRQAGNPLYVMMLEVQLGSAAKAKTLQKALDRLARALRLEIVLHDIEPIAL